MQCDAESTQPAFNALRSILCLIPSLLPPKRRFRLRSLAAVTLCRSFARHDRLTTLLAGPMKVRTLLPADHLRTRLGVQLAGSVSLGRQREDGQAMISSFNHRILHAQRTS